MTDDKMCWKNVVDKKNYEKVVVRRETNFDKKNLWRKYFCDNNQICEEQNCDEEEENYLKKNLNKESFGDEKNILMKKKKMWWHFVCENKNLVLKRKIVMTKIFGEKNQIGTKTKNSYFDKAQKLKLWPNEETQILTELKNSKSDKNEKYKL